MNVAIHDALACRAHAGQPKLALTLPTLASAASSSLIMLHSHRTPSSGTRHAHVRGLDAAALDVQQEILFQTSVQGACTCAVKMHTELLLVHVRQGSLSMGS